jgi:hypothetical protein
MPARSRSGTSACFDRSPPNLLLDRWTALLPHSGLRQSAQPSVSKASRSIFPAKRRRQSSAQRNWRNRWPQQTRDSSFYYHLLYLEKQVKLPLWAPPNGLCLYRCTSRRSRVSHFADAATAQALSRARRAEPGSSPDLVEAYVLRTVRALVRIAERMPREKLLEAVGAATDTMSCSPRSARRPPLAPRSRRIRPTRSPKPFCAEHR